MEFGICPVCNGSGRVPAGDYEYKRVVAGYDSDTDTLSCRNCGGQTMSLKGTGQVRLRSDGTPCTHKYVSKNIGRCLTEYLCIHCGSKHQIDSGD